MRIIRWTDEALGQALEIREYLAVTSPEYAERIIDNLFQRAAQLAEFPHSGPVYKRAGLPQIRELLVRLHRLVYEVTNLQIRIIAVFRQRQNP